MRQIIIGLVLLSLGFLAVTGAFVPKFRLKAGHGGKKKSTKFGQFIMGIVLVWVAMDTLFSIGYLDKPWAVCIVAGLLCIAFAYELLDSYLKRPRE